MRTIIGLTLAGGALATLAACAPAPQQQQPAPVITTTAASGAGGGSTETQQRGVGAGVGAGVGVDWTWVDWAAVTHGSIGDCPAGDGVDPHRTEVDGVTFADLTGDGRTEAVVAAACQTTTAGNAVRVFVYDGRYRTAPHRLLLTVGVDDYLKAVDVEASGDTLTVTAGALSEDAARCCPDLIVTERWRWADGRFERRSRAVQPVRAG